MGGLEYKGLITLLTWLKTRAFSSGDEQTIEKVPARSPYNPRFLLISLSLDTEMSAQEADLGKRLAQQDLMALLNKVSRSKGVLDQIT